MANTYYGKNGEMRFYDGAGTPNWMKLRFSEMNLTVPEGPGRPEEIVRLHRGQLDPDTHYVQGTDEPILAPMPMSTSMFLEAGVNKDLLHEFLAIRYANGQQTTWEAGGVPTALTTTKGTTQRAAGLTGTLVTLPPFTDPRKKCVNCLGLWDDLDSNLCGRRLNETYFPPAEQSLNESADAVRVNLSGQVYGSCLVITAFPAGTEITAA